MPRLFSLCTPSWLTLLLLLASSSCSSAQVVVSQYTAWSSAPQNWYTWDSPSASIQNAPAGSGQFQRQNLGHAGHSGLAYFAGAAIAPAVIAGTATIDPTVNSGAYLNLAVYPDQYNRTVTQTVGGPLSFEFWAEFETFREWSRLLDWGSCGGCDNIVMAQNGRGGDNNSPSFSFHLVNGGTTTAPVTTAAPGQVTDCDFSTNGPLHQNEWMHIVCTVSQRYANDSTSLTAADLACYFNGRAALVTAFNYALTPPSTAYTSAGALPNAVMRNNLFLGQSNYGGASNFNFNGWLDSFSWYNYALTGEAAAAHSQVQRPPIFEFVAASNPHLIATADAASTGYTWSATDTTDSAAVQTLHSGVIKLAAASSQWINLAATTGSSAVGTSLTTVFGDGLSYNLQGGNNANSAGYTFELWVKLAAPTGASASKILEIGNGAQTQEVVLNLVTTSSTAGSITFNVYRSDVASVAAYTVVPTVTFGSWYHLVVVLAPTGTAGAATVTGWVNGVAQPSGSLLFPQNVTRSQAQIGKSSWTTETYTSLTLDAFRMYDYSLTPAVVGALYNLSIQGLPPSQSVVIPPVTQFTAGPQLAYTFDTSPVFATANDAYDTNFTWVQSMTALNSPPYANKNLTRTGVASFNGVYQTGDFVDMTVQPDSLGNTFTFPFGGALSFEASFMYYAAAFVSLAPASGYNYLFSTSGELGQGNNNLGFTSVAWNPWLMLSDWYGTSSTNSHVTDSYSAPNNVIAYPNQWQHVIVSVQPTPANSYGALNSNCTIYYNGLQVWQQACPTPQWVIRSNAYLGRSSDDANCRLSGAIDSFYFYNYALSAEAAALHYAVPRAPRFELDFAVSPAAFTNQTTTAYGWMAAYTSHTGVLQLTSSAGPGWGSAAATGQWVNLAVQAGSTSVGAALPLIGGYGTGLTLGAQLGWTFEVTFQVTSSSATPNMVLFDMTGAVSAQDEFLVNFVPGSCAMQVTAYGGTAGLTMTNITVIPCVTTGRWYHLVVAMTTSTITATRATYRSYVNGVLTNVVNGVALRQVPRANAFIGRSLADASASQATLAFSGMIDALRWYDYAVIPDNVLAMFNVTSSDAPAIPATPFFSAAPMNQWTFDAAPTSLVQGSFVYESTRTAHYGVAYFRSSTTTTVLTSLNQVDLTQPYGDWLNLVNVPDYTGTPMPVTWGGTAVSFEAWVQWSEFQPWSRVFDFGACGGCDNVFVAQNGNSANSPIMSFHEANGGTTSAPNTAAGVGSVTDCDTNANGTATGPLQLNVWLHIVCEIQPRDPFELASLQAGDYKCWVNGVPQVIYNTNYAVPALATPFSTPGPIPNVVARPLALMGLSNYVGNYAFNGWIDSLMWYNTALSQEAVQWHYTAPRPPTVFEVTASPDPRLTTGTTQLATFGWMASDPTDSAALQALHTGLISLSAGQSQYVDMTVGQGAASLGQTLGTFGDGLGYTGQVVNSSGSTTGYSFEVLIKLPAPLSSTSSKVFEIGNGPQSNEVVLNYVGSTNALTFNSYRTGYTTPSDITVVAAVQAGQWYHIHVTLSTGTSSTSASSTCTVYVNGVQVGSPVTNAVSPAAMARTQATLGRSSWTGEGYLTALIDSFRIYDYVLPASAVTALYTLSSAGLPIPPPVVASSFYAYQSGPQLAYTLDSAPPSNALTLDTNFTWTAASTLYPNPDGTSTPHTGVAQFNGLYETGSSIDLVAYPDSAGRTFGFNIGGSMSFESWFLYYTPLRTSLTGTISNGYDYIFSLGGVIGQNSNNIGMCTIGWTAQMMYTVFLGATTQHVTDTAGTIVIATPGIWQHMILSIQQLNASVPSGNSAANCTIYISGRVAWTQLCNVPQWVLRPNAFLGRSPDDQNLRHWGEIDSWYLYNYALSQEAAALHYVVPRAPVMELVFDRDPQQVTATATSQYTWQAGSGTHSGLLSLSGSGQYVDLSTATGANSIGTMLPALPLSAAGVGVSQAQYGWTLEMNFMVSAAAAASPNMVLLDIGTATAGTDELLLQYTPGACTVQLTVYGGSAGTTAVPVVMSPTCIAPGTWYSVIVTASLTSATASTYQGYINGVATGSAVSAGATIRTVARSVGYLGKAIGASSATAGTLPFNGVIDSVRLYDFAATAAQVAKIVTVTNSVSPPQVSSSSAAPVRSSSAASSAATSVASTAAPTSVLPSTQGATSSLAPTSVSPPTGAPYVTSSVAPSTSSSSSLSSGAIAGIVIGAVVGATVLLCLLWVFCCSAAFRNGKKTASDQPEGASHRHDELQDTDQSTHRRDDEVEMTDASAA